MRAVEIADLLVVFESDVIIFSDKDCEFPDTDDPDLDWARWYRRAIVASARQLWGAERQRSCGKVQGEVRW
jgi:hypothetical protein